MDKNCAVVVQGIRVTGSGVDWYFHFVNDNQYKGGKVRFALSQTAISSTFPDKTQVITSETTGSVPKQSKEVIGGGAADIDFRYDPPDPADTSLILDRDEDSGSDYYHVRWISGLNVTSSTSHVNLLKDASFAAEVFVKDVSGNDVHLASVGDVPPFQFFSDPVDPKKNTPSIDDLTPYLIAIVVIVVLVLNAAILTFIWFWRKKRKRKHRKEKEAKEKEERESQIRMSSDKYKDKDKASDASTSSMDKDGKKKIPLKFA